MQDSRRARSCDISFSDVVMSAVAMFALKFPSMLLFEIDHKDETIGNNLKTLFGLRQIPCDTTMREILDPVVTTELLKLFLPLYQEAQREGAEGFVQGSLSFERGWHRLLALLRSIAALLRVAVHKKERTYYQMLWVLVHPLNKESFPCPEPIVRQDGQAKRL
jgi:hypothetical protein